jgi:DNA-binding transcriptional MerR regulator
MTTMIPDKLFFKIGEVSEITGLESYILRYWESEFPILKPTKNKAGQRLYTKDNIDLVLKIKSLLYDEKYTIDGARKFLNDRKRELDQDIEQDSVIREKRLKNCLEEVKSELESILAVLDKQ